MVKHRDNSFVLFDGVCNLCNTSVSLIIKYDHKAFFKFSPLQSDFSKKALKSEIANNQLPESIVLLEGNKIYYRSTAALRIARRMDGLWSMFYLLIILPEPIRDFMYDLVARYRYKIFGRKNSCMVPGEDIESRFV